MSAIVSSAGSAPDLARVRAIALVAGVVGLAVCGLGLLVIPEAMAPAYLVGYLFWVGLALGCVSLTMLHHLVHGSWGVFVRRPLEAGAMTLVPLAPLFLPLLLVLPTLYPWARPASPGVEAEPLPNAGYLNVPGFVTRAAIYFALWIGMALTLNWLSDREDREESGGPSRWLEGLSGPGLILIFLTATFASIDWAMSLEPRWYSTLYGPMVIIGWALETFAFAILASVWLAGGGRGGLTASAARLHDLGNLMLAFVMLWGYLSFSQFLIIYSGNLIEEVPWYLRRTGGGWQVVVLFLIAFHFALPFLVLLFRENKRNPRPLMWAAASLLAVHLIDIAWLVLPSRAEDPRHPFIPWGALLLVPVATAAIGGVWLAAFLWWLGRRPAAPLHDPAELPDGAIPQTGGLAS